MQREAFQGKEKKEYLVFSAVKNVYEKLLIFYDFDTEEEKFD